MQQILKRLELIKTSIALEDEEIIELQVIKIKSLSYDAEVASIIKALEGSDFAAAVNEIELYINCNMGLMLYEDKALQGLKLELKVLERRLQSLAEQRNDYDTDIDDFNREYSLRLGAIIQQVLSLREKILYQQISVKKKVLSASKTQLDKAKKEVADAKKAIEEIESLLGELDKFSDDYEALYAEYKILKEELSQKEEVLSEKRSHVKKATDDLDNDPANTEYEAAQEDSASFEKEYIDLTAVDAYELDAEQEKALKLAYRKACMLCHPDIVSDELKEQAHTIMSKLNAAKKEKNLELVEEILLKLQSGGGFDVASDTIQDKALLGIKIAEIKENIAAVEEEISSLELSESFQLIQSIEDKELYFEDLKAQLEAESEQLRKQLQSLQTDGDKIYYGASINHPSNDDYDAYQKMMAEEEQMKPKGNEQPPAAPEGNYWTEEI